MRKSILSILVALAASASVSEGVVISFVTGGARGHQMLNNNGSRILTTNTVGNVNDPASRVAVGYLTTPGLSSSFVEFATTTINNPLSTQAIGGFVNTATANNSSPTTVAALKGKQIALWIYGQNGNQGLFTSANWLVPDTITVDPDSTFDVRLGIASTDLATLAPVVTGVPITGFTLATYLFPRSITVGTGATATNPQGATYTLGAIVPEPGSVGLLALAGLAMLRRRR